MKKRAHNSVPPADAAPAASITQRLQRLWLVGLTALLVATPLLPSEAAASEGTGIVLVMMWLVLLVAWCTSKLLRKDALLHSGATAAVFGGLLMLIVISTLVMLSQGHARPMINTVWQWVSFGVAFLLCREILRTEIQQRSVVAVMLGLAVCLSVHGYYQAFYSLPKTRREFEANPAQALREAGIVAPPGTPAYEQFKNRLLYSTEPAATFTLTNSLAGFLSPWLLIAIGAGWTGWRDSRFRTRIVPGLVCCAVLIAGCWLLTKSRTAWLATVFGLGLMLIYTRPTGWRPDWRLVAGLIIGPVVLVFFGMIVGSLDLLVVTESAKSLQYRFEYWQSTAAMIADYPWFGCGPGNFQQFYTSYKLPAASEVIRDPHNFLLEVWATAGTPAALVLMVLLLVFAIQVRRAISVASQSALGAATSETPTTKADASAQATPRPAADVWFIYLGALVGVLIAYFPCGFLVGFMPDFAVLLVGLPAGVAALTACHAWVMHGRLNFPTLLCAIAALLVNLLAAGGITFAGVSVTLWLLLALVLNAVQHQRPAPQRPQGIVWGLTATAWLLLLFCQQTAYGPILNSDALVAEASTLRQLGRTGRAEETLLRAAAADPYTAKPWFQLATLRHEDWLLSASRVASRPSGQAAFEEAVAEMLKRNPRSASWRLQVGHWQLLAFRASNQPEDLQAAVDAYGQAVELYPNNSLARAHAAWADFLKGEATRALAAAEQAVRLDEITPHREQKLAAQAISDPGPRWFPDQHPGPAENAEQTMTFVRNQLYARATRPDP